MPKCLDGVLVDRKILDVETAKQKSKLDCLLGDFNIESTESKGSGIDPDQDLDSEAKYCLKCQAKVTKYAIEDATQYAKEVLNSANMQYRSKSYALAKSQYDKILVEMTSFDNFSNGGGDRLLHSNQKRGTQRFKCLLNSVHTMVYRNLINYLNCCLALHDYLASINCVNIIIDCMKLVYPKYNLETASFIFQKASMYLKLQDTQKTRITSGKKKILSQKKLKNLTIEDLNLAIEIYETIFDSC